MCYVLFSAMPSCCLNEGWGSSTHNKLEYRPWNNVEYSSEKREEEPESLMNVKPLHQSGLTTSAHRGRELKYLYHVNQLF